MRFRFIDQARQDFPAHRLCKVMNVSQSGYFAWKDRPASRRQREDMVMLAHVRSAYTLSHETYGSPRMSAKNCRTAALLSVDGEPPGSCGIMACMLGRSAGSSAPRIASMPSRSPPTSPIRILLQPGQTSNGVSIFPMSGSVRGGCISRS